MTRSEGGGVSGMLTSGLAMPPTVTAPPRDLPTVDNSARMSGREQEAAVSDYSAGERGTPNGPAPYPPRVEEARPPAGPAASGTTTTDRPAASQPPAVQPTAAQPPAVQPTAAQPAAPPSELKGRIHIADEVVEKVAGLAAMEVPGVADLGGDFARALES